MYAFNTSSEEYLITNSLSIVCSLVVVVMTMWLRFFTPVPVTRATLSLQAAIALVDLVRHLRLLMNNHQDEAMCSFLGFVSVFADHLAILLNVAIAASLHRVYLLGRMPGKMWHRLLWVIPVSFAFVIDALPLGKHARFV